MLKPSDLKIKTVSEEGAIAVFEFEPFPKGLGLTIGNALRRVLLTSIEGAAITQIKVAGVKHQFSVIEGVKEDAVELGLNFKNLRFKHHGDQPVIAMIEKEGPGEVKASDINCPSDIEVINDKQHIATLAGKETKLEIELTIEKGLGYSPVEERESSKIGVILLDALFSPVIKAVYEIEPARFEDKTDLDKLVLTVETDGSVDPKDAVLEATEKLKNFFERILNWDTPAVVEDAESEEDAVKDLDNVEEILVVDLPLPTRTINALRKHGTETLRALAKLSEEELADIKNIGEKSLDEVTKLLKKEGLK